VIEKNFGIPFIADLALREKQIQQNYRSIIAIHKWFARRPGTLFRGLLLSVFPEKPLHDAFYQANSLQGIKVADPFMGGWANIIDRFQKAKAYCYCPFEIRHQGGKKKSCR
jgi:putative DNA methylase